MKGLSITVNRFSDPDQAYRLLIDAHRGLSDVDSAALNARLVLILANQIGDVGILGAAIALARAVSADVPPTPSRAAAPE